MQSPESKYLFKFSLRGFIIWIGLIIWLLSGLSSLAFARIAELAENSYSPLNNIIGGASTNIYGPRESAIYNSALLGSEERNGVGMGYGNLDTVNLFWVQGYISSSLGVLTTNLGYFRDENSESGIQNYFLWEIGYARKFAKHFSFGLDFKPAYGQGKDGGFFFLGIEPSLLFEVQKSFSSDSGFGLYAPRFYIVSRNLGYNFGDSANVAPDISLHLGTQFSIFDKNSFSIGLNVEYLGIGDFSELPFKFGIFLNYLYFRLGFGYSINSNETALFRGPSAGLGFVYDSEIASVDFNYSILFPQAPGTGLFHAVSVNSSFGLIDKSPPIVNIERDVTSFSPNWDGKKDYANFKIQVEDDSPIQSWSFVIQNAKGDVVRKFEKDTRSVEKPFGIKEFFTHFFISEEHLVVPSQIRWDGTGESILLEEQSSEASKRNDLPDGNYAYTFVTTDIKKNRSKPIKSFIEIDRTPPIISVSSSSSIFSPNEDGVLETLTILHKTKPKHDDAWEASFLNSEGKPVRSYSWRANQIPKEVAWNGTDDNGVPLPEGLYSYRITGADASGNRGERVISQISLVRKVDVVDIKLSSEGFSPNGDKTLDTLTIDPVLSDEKDIVSWTITLTKNPVEAEERLEAEDLSEQTARYWSGENKAPSKIIWNGKNTEKKEVLEDGGYYLRLSVRYRSGNYPASLSKKVVIDTAPPELQISAEEDTFSPDGDGENEEQIFDLSIKDSSAIQSYRVSLYENARTKKGKQQILFKKFEGENTYPPKIYWDGKGEKGSLVESATEYEFKAVAEDIYGNKGESPVGSFETDILVLVHERGLKIRISNAEFDLGKANLKKRTKRILKKLASLLNRYPAYRVKVEGHTDDLGEEDYNLRLSEDRARAVTDFLIDTGVDKNRLSFQGLGEVSPLLPNKNWYSRSRNRRVEFFLTKSPDLVQNSETETNDEGVGAQDSQ